MPARRRWTSASRVALAACAVLAWTRPALTQPSPSAPALGVLRLVWLVPLDHLGKSEVQFEEDIQDTGYAHEIQGRSLEGAADVDCATRQFRLIRMVIYPLPKRGGEPVLRIGARPDWRMGEANTTMARVVSAACSAIRRPQPAGPQPAASPLAAVAVALPAPSLSPPEPQAAATPPAPTPASAEWIATQKTLVEPPPTPAAAQPNPVPPAPARPAIPAPKPLPPATPPDPAPSKSVAQPVSAPAPKPAPGAPSSGPYYVQLAAATSADLAEQAWRGAQITNPAQLSGLHERTEQQRVKGVLFYRVLVGGFADAEAAGHLCKALGRGANACWVRKLDP